MKVYPTKPIGELCKLINGRAFKPSEWENKGLPIVRIQNLNDLSKPFNRFDGKYSDNHFIDNGAILLSWSGKVSRAPAYSAGTLYRLPSTATRNCLDALT